MDPGFDGIVRRDSDALCAPITLGSFAAMSVASLGAGGLVRVLGLYRVGGGIAEQEPAMWVTGER